MKYSIALPTPLEYFASLVASDVQFPLLEAAISLAQDEYPNLDVEQALDEVDQMLLRLRGRLAADAGPLQKLRVLNHFFFHELRFAVNLNHFDDPRNSFINVVLDTRRGIPISLAVIWLELALSLGLCAGGIGFPGHFLLKVTLPQGQVVLDPLDGLSLSHAALERRLEEFRVATGLPDGYSIPLGMYLQTSSPREIIARMLRNLKKNYLDQEDWHRIIAVQNRLIVLLPHAWIEYRDRGMAFAMVGQASAALRDLETYLANDKSNPDMQVVSSQVAALKLMKG